jgi:divalent metal cation (Fe/Co/Zn/Cd) transporter
MTDPISAIAVSVRAGLRVSVLSLIWTLLVGGGSVGIGLDTGSLAVTAFGVVGLLDAIGSASLVAHFVHARGRDAPSERLELITLRIVVIGLGMTGLATTAVSVSRLVQHESARASHATIVVSVLSIAVLALLASWKRRVAARIPSPALHADSWVSAVGAILAVVASVGVIARASAGWWWADSAAASIVGLIAVGVSVLLLTGVPRGLAGPSANTQSMTTSEGGSAGTPRGDRPQDERRQGDRRQGDRRVRDVGPPDGVERRKAERRKGERRRG